MLLLSVLFALFGSAHSAPLHSILYVDKTELIRQDEAGIHFLPGTNPALRPVGICAVDMNHIDDSSKNLDSLARSLSKFSGLILYGGDHIRSMTPINRVIFSNDRLESLGTPNDGTYVTPYGPFVFHSVQSQETGGELSAMGARIDVMPNGDGTSSAYFRSGRELFYGESITHVRDHLPMKCVFKNPSEIVQEPNLKVVTQPIQDRETGMIAYLACYPTESCSSLRVVQINPRTHQAYWSGRPVATQADFNSRIDRKEITRISKQIYKNTIAWKDRLFRYSYYEASKLRLHMAQSLTAPSSGIVHLAKGQEGWNWSSRVRSVSHQKFFDFIVGSQLSAMTFERSRQQIR